MAVIECPHCGAPVHIEHASNVRSGHDDVTSTGREWVMHEGRSEVHRCPDTAGGRPHPPTAA